MGSSPPTPRSSSSSEWLMAETCSRLSVRKSSAYWALSTRVSLLGGGRWAAHGGREAGARRARLRRGYCGATLAASPQNALHGFEDSAGLERFYDEILCTSLNGLDDQRLLPHRAAHQDLGVHVELRDLADRVDATHVRHHDVHRDQIRTQLLVLLHRLYTRLRLADDLEPCLLQDVADHRAHEDRVVADENRMTHSIAPLEQDLRDQRVNVDENDDVALQMPETTYQRIACASVGLDVLLRDALHVHHLVHRDADDVRTVGGEDDRPLPHGRTRRGEARSEIQHRHDRAAKVDQTLDERRRARQSRGAPIRDDLSHRIDVAAVHLPRHPEQQGARGGSRFRKRLGRSQSAPAGRYRRTKCQRPPRR